jgi:hypothetical protein
MKSEIEKYERIEQFLSGRLSTEEIKKVEDLIASDPEFAKVVQQHRQIFNFILDSSIVELKEHVRSIHEKKTQSVRIRNSRIKIGIVIVTGLVITGLILYLVFTDKKNIKRQTLPVTIDTPAPKSNNSTILKPVTEVANQPEISNPENNRSGIPMESEPDAIKIRKVTPNGIIINRTDDTNEIINISKPRIKDEASATNQEPQQSEKDNAPLLPEDFDCSQVSIFAEVSAEKSCENEPTGAIIIDESTISGGSPPYELSIDNQENYHAASHFSSLQPNYYNVWIRDKNNCPSWLGSVLIELTECGYKDIFAPEKGEEWELPNQGQPCRLWIFNQGSVLVFEASYNFPGSYSWDGCNTSGEMLPMGAYTFILRLENETPLQGSVTIIR